MTKDDKRSIAGLTLLLLLIGLPFVHRAYFVDDYYHVTMARGILIHPARPYDFQSDDAGHGHVGWERGQAPRMVNPPLFHYFLASVMALWGQETWRLRTASLLFPWMSLVAAYFLGKRFSSAPALAAGLMAVTPVFWLSAYSLLIDSAMLAFILLGLWAFISAQETHKVTRVLLAGLCMAAAVLTKYTGFVIVPLCLSWQLLSVERRSWKIGYVPYAIVILLLGVWGIWTLKTYGQMHFLAAFPRGMQGASWVGWGQKALLLGSFIAGSTLFVLLSPLILSKISPRWTVALTALCVLLFLMLHSRAGGFDLTQSLLLSIFVSATLSFGVSLAHSLQGARDERKIFLFGWVALGLLELLTVMPWTAARYLLVILPPLVWLFVDLPEPVRRKIFLTWAFLLTAIPAFFIALADYAQAGAIVTMAHRLVADNSQLEKAVPKNLHHWYFLGDTFDGHDAYLGSLGWESAFASQTFASGDLILRCRIRQSAWWTLDHPERFRRVMLYELPSRNPFRVMDIPGSAGFYASVWGALPWTLTNHPLEQFELLQVQ